MMRLLQLNRTGGQHGIVKNFSTALPTSTLMSDVHGKKEWRNKPLFRRQGDKKFRTGLEASEMLYVFQ